MASGVETAGLILATIPLILGGLEFYAKGIAVTKRYLRYRAQFNELIRDLRAEHTIYVNTVQILLTGVVRRSEMPQFLAEPCGARWKRKEFENHLKSRLGMSYGSYLDTIIKMNDTAHEFKSRLKLDSQGMQQFTEDKSFREQYKRLKFSLNKQDYSDLMAQLRQANSTLHRMTTQTLSLEGLQTSSRAKLKPIPRFTAIAERAHGCYAALQSGWKCPCHAHHTVSLRLEPRIDDVSSEDEDEQDMRPPFHILLGYGDYLQQSETVPRKRWHWEEIEVYLTSVSLNTGVATPPNNSRGCKTVRFAEYKKAVKAAFDPVPDLRPIQGLCTAISQLQSPQRDLCFDILAAEVGTQKFGLRVFPQRATPSNPELWATSTLRSILNDTKFTKRSRLELALTLSSSVLQLHNTPWIEGTLDKENIIFLRRDSKNGYDSPFISRKTRRQLMLNSDPGLISLIIRNPTIYSLGILLIEIWHGKTLEELHGPDDGALNTGDPLNDVAARFKLADRLLNNLYDDAGAKYTDAVRRCIRCEFDCRATDLNDVAFQNAVYRGVVAQLKETLDFLYMMI